MQGIGPVHTDYFVTCREGQMSEAMWRAYA